MLSQLLFVRLRAAEKACRDGRLDEAYRLASAPDIRNHRRGAAVLASLTEKFVERARDHYRKDRFTEALMDLDKAESGGVMRDEIAELRGHVQIVAAEDRRRQQSHHDRLHMAKRRIEGGSLAAGRKMLAQTPAEDPDAAKLRKIADERVEQAGDLTGQIEELMDQSQYAAAADQMRKLKSVDAHAEGGIGLEKRLCDEVIEHAKAALADGKIKRAGDELACLDSLGKHLPARREVDDMISIATQAATAWRNHDFANARCHAMSLKRLLPGAKWVNETVEQLRQLEDLHTVIAAGPMGSVPDETPLVPTATPSGQAAVAPPFANPIRLDNINTVVPPAATPPGTLPTKLLLLVDGGGSYLIIRDGRASVGRAAAHLPADIPLFSDIASRHAHLERVEDDYFLFGDEDVEIAGQAVKHHLLRNGDRIVLGKTAKLIFRLPSRKSPTAVLDLSDTTKMPNDVRRIVLFHQQAMLGEGPHAHIPCRHAGPPLVLFARRHELWVRQRSDGHNDIGVQPLRPGESIEVGGARISLEPWRVRPPGMTVA